MPARFGGVAVAFLGFLGSVAVAVVVVFGDPLFACALGFGEAGQVAFAVVIVGGGDLFFVAAADRQGVAVVPAGVDAAAVGVAQFDDVAVDVVGGVGLPALSISDGFGFDVEVFLPGSGPVCPSAT